MYGVRVTIAVEGRDEAGPNEDLTLDWAVHYMDAGSPAEALRWAANETPARVAKQLVGAAPVGE